MDFDPLPQQRLAIEAPLGPVLVVAGPGAGKTFCLIARINHLINTRGLAPERICAVTFTNRAAEEIAVRLKHTLGDRAEGVTRGTIHALCLALLREHAEAAGLRKGFGVADEQYQKVILGRLHVPLEQRGSLLNRFSRHRVQDYRLTDDDARLYREYAVWLAHRNMLDFDDLVVKAEELVRTHGDIADAIAARWDYLLVDEFQDVNAVQYDLIKYVSAALGIVRDPGDPVALEAFARCVLSPHFLQEVLASPPFPLSANAERGDVGDFLSVVRTLARRRPAQDPDTKKLWRLVFQVENLRALTRSHRALVPLVDEILSQCVGPYRNALEERHDELTDPAAIPEAVRLAERLAGAIAAERDIVIEPQGGLEIALRGMLAAAGVRNLPSQVSGPSKPRGTAPGLTHPGETLVKADGGEHGLGLTLFKTLQLMQAKELDTALERYVTFDLETTDKDVEVCEVVEVGAVRVVGGEIVDRFHTLVQPYRSITPGATAIHGYTDADVRGARSFGEVWPEFRAFIGDDVLIAHNGQHFDIPVLRRLAAGRDGVDSLVF